MRTCVRACVCVRVHFYVHADTSGNIPIYSLSIQHTNMAEVRARCSWSSFVSNSLLVGRGVSMMLEFHLLAGVRSSVLACVRDCVRVQARLTLICYS